MCRRIVGVLIALLLYLLACGEDLDQKLHATWEGALDRQLEYEAVWSGDGAERLRDSLGGDIDIDFAFDEQYLAYHSSSLGRCIVYQVVHGVIGDIVYSTPLPLREDTMDTRGKYSARMCLVEYLDSMRHTNTKAIRSSIDEINIKSWTAPIHLDTLDEIIDRYRSYRSQRISSLVKWLGRPRSDGRMIVRYIIPCFLDSDPDVAVYVVYNSGDQDIIIVKWNGELSDWEFAAFYTSPFQSKSVADRDRVDRCHRLISSLACEIGGRQ